MTRVIRVTTVVRRFFRVLGPVFFVTRGERRVLRRGIGAGFT